MTNVFRDQLDRYGEVSHTLSAIQESVNNLPAATLVINGDCSLTNTLKRENTVTYGVSVPLDQTSAVRDGTRCIHCKHQLEYDYFTYAHLGKYRCPGCGYCRETPDYNVTDIVETTPDSSTAFSHLGKRRKKPGKKHQAAANSSSAAGQNMPIWHTPMASGIRK